jgi:TusE/DsrC/DsvC family sulfur relay protein
MGMSGLDSVEPGSIYTVRNVDGKEVTFDEEGFLLDPDSWNERLAEMLALEDGLPELSTIHWHVISFLRQYYFANGKAPLNSELRKGTGLSLSEIEACFPRGIRQGARRLAGLPNPRGCA